MTANEKANVKLVNDFCAAWPSHDLAKVMFFLQAVRGGVRNHRIVLELDQSDMFLGDGNHFAVGLYEASRAVGQLSPVEVFLLDLQTRAYALIGPTDTDDPTGGVIYASLDQYMVFSNHEEYILTFTTTADEADSKSFTFDNIAASFTLTK